MSLAAKLRGIREPAGRVALLAEQARDADPHAFVAELDDLARAALQREADAEEMTLALVRPIAVFADIDRLNVLADTAGEDRKVLALQWLWSAKAAHAASVRRDLPASQNLVDRALAQLTLGDRRALARRADRDQLTRLAGDPDPVVVEHVLVNPRTTESLVVTASARRPTVSAALEAVIRSAWLARRPVRVALVHNPYLATHAAVPLLFTLPRVEIAAVRDDESLTGSLRLSAGRLCS